MLDFPSDQKFRNSVMQDQITIFKHCFRLLRCIVDCQRELQDSTSVLSALKLARCIHGKVWENTASELRQLENIGPASIRKFVNAGVRSISKLLTLPAYQIETIMSRNPPFGTNVLKNAKLIPQFKISLQQVGSPKVCPCPAQKIKFTDSLAGRKTGSLAKLKLGYSQRLGLRIRTRVLGGIKDPS